MMSPDKAAAAILAAGWRKGAEVTAAEKAMDAVMAAVDAWPDDTRNDIDTILDIARIVGAYSVERIGDAK